MNARDQFWIHVFGNGDDMGFIPVSMKYDGSGFTFDDAPYYLYDLIDELIGYEYQDDEESPEALEAEEKRGNVFNSVAESILFACDEGKSSDSFTMESIKLHVFWEIVPQEDENF